MAIVSLFAEAFLKEKPILTAIDVINVDATVTENHEASARVTSNPIESGSNVADHVILEPRKLSLDCVVSESPIRIEQSLIGAAAGAIGGALGGLAGSLATTGIAVLGSALLGQETNRSRTTYQKLLELRNRRQPIQVVTGLETYGSMIITSVGIPRDNKTGRSLRFSLSFEEVTMVDSETIPIPKDKVSAMSAANMVNRGKQAATDPNAGASLAYRLLM